MSLTQFQIFRMTLLFAGTAFIASCQASKPVESYQTNAKTHVLAVAETEPVGSVNEDAADDPAIWRHPENAEQSLIVATDKKAGLYIYDLNGQRRFFIDAGRVNNVDLDGTLVIASDRNDLTKGHIALFRLDARKASLTSFGRVAVAAGEAYGICMQQTGEPDPTKASIALVMKDGLVIVGDVVSNAGATPTFVKKWSHRLATQAEGCVFDGSTLYVGEEGQGIWRITEENGRPTANLVAKIDNDLLTADVEGLAIIDDADGKFLIASSQGSNSYALFELPSFKAAGSFSIAAGAKIDGTSETDGIAASSGNFGKRYPNGIFVAQDGDNAPQAQNFKLVSWRDIRPSPSK